ncbi:family 78 glycoside hydrolase catalytic domain [Sphingobacterium pedocola]|uniref:alpha-L-rhamnosidase n=1 Tax=Sphingobacterium pedocola TaxID=2082722 RepID=A0ABR9T9M6_9SPHI|nr:family 78 glycoside hydrolase catalytic domain [Sphingobacterium pedocola]MBE8722005.1 alpha-L-rhamnosidase [Sphingobacterium pedocola]
MRYIILFCLLHTAGLSFASDLKPVNLRVEYKDRPFVDERVPRLSWELTAKKHNQFQSAYQVIVASSLKKLKRNEGDLWDSGKQTSQATNQIVYDGVALSSRQRVWWKVKVWDANNRQGKWSEVNHWEMGLLNQSDWHAKWIGYDLNHLAKGGTYHLPPSPYLRKEVRVQKEVRVARLYISSLGLHEFYINGDKVGRDYFGSGWTDYDMRVYYQVYDVTKHLQQGGNTFGAVLSNGWYAGYLGYALFVGSPQVRAFYGDFPLLKAQVEIQYSDGSSDIISTDEQWKASAGALMESDFLQGETYDATKEMAGWDRPRFDDTDWRPAQVMEDNSTRKIQLYPGEPVRVVEELPIKSIRRLDNGKYIVDFGQNFAGIIRARMLGQAHDTLVFRYGEMLHLDGTLVTENLRSARATDTYILKGNPEGEVWSPRFTYHGFQYVEITGLKEAPAADFLVGLALSSDLETAGYFESDNELLNKLYRNIVWTQRANYLDIPTDCPQRDERLAWTGDAQVYIRSAVYNNNIAAFHTKWIQDLNDAQWPNGAFPIYAPMPVNKAGIPAIRSSDTYSPGWSEAGVICTYEIFRAYNDLRMVKRSLPYMVKFMDFLATKANNLGVLPEGIFEEIEPNGGFGDWLSIGKKTSPDLLATLYYFYCAKLMKEMCEAIQEDELTQRYGKTAEIIHSGFLAHYTDAGKFKTDSARYGDGAGYVEGQNGFSGHTQTAYANAIYMLILEEEDLEYAGRLLRQLVEENDDKLTTGFLGFKPLLPALSRTNSSDKAYKLLLSTEYPSLGYEVVNGATSIWERWDSYTKDQGFVHNAAMNSFSHYAFGAINEWIFEYMIGIKPIDRGFRSFTIKPELPPKNIPLKSVKGTYHSIAGRIQAAWRYEDNVRIHELEIPVNTTAYFYIEARSLEDIYINGKVLGLSEWASSVEQVGVQYKLQLGSGKYTFKINQHP